MDLSQMLRAIATHCRVDNFGKDEEGKKLLVFDDEIIVTFDDQARRDGLWISAPLAPLPEEDRDPFLRRVLQTNVFFALRGNALLTIEGNHVVLQQYIDPSTLSLSQVGSTIEAFLNTAEGWRKKLQHWESRQRKGESMAAFHFLNPTGVIRP